MSTGRHVISAHCELCFLSILSPLGRISRGGGEAGKSALEYSTRPKGRERQVKSQAKPGEPKLILIDAPEIRSPNLCTPVCRPSPDPKVGLDVYPRFPGPPKGILALIRKTDNQRVECWPSRIAIKLWEGSRIRSVALPPVLIAHVPLSVPLSPLYVLRLPGYSQFQTAVQLWPTSHGYGDLTVHAGQ